MFSLFLIFGASRDHQREKKMKTPAAADPIVWHRRKLSIAVIVNRPVTQSAYSERR